MSDGIAQDQLQSFVRRIESVEDEIKALNSDKSEIYKEVRGCGYDVKVLRKVIAARRLDAEERMEQGALFELYWDAIEGVEYRVVRAHVENIEEFPVEHDADGVFPDEEPQSAPQAARDLTIPTALTGQVAPIQPETATSGEAQETAAAVGASPAIQAAEDIGAQPAGGDHEEVTDALISTETAASAGGMENDSTVMVRADASELALSSDVEPVASLSFADKIKKLRPLCQQPGACRSSGGKAHCYICMKTTEQAVAS